MDRTVIKERIARLREELRREHLGAFIFPTSDPHNSEYTAEHWKGREWISGFNGSAGTAVVTLNSAALWTDSRYFIAAEEQLWDTEFQLMKLKVEGTPTIAEWLGKELKDAEVKEVGIDGMVNATNSVKKLISELRAQGGITLRTNFDPLQRIWQGRPAIPENPVVIQPLEYAGETTHEKLVRIRKALREQHADGMLMTALDEIAWTLNLRGSDVHCSPVFVAYLLISTTEVILYINKVKLTPDAIRYLQTEGVGVKPYDEVRQGLKDYFEYNILLDGDTVNYTLYKSVEREIVDAPSPVVMMKAVKNEREIAGFKSAMLKDGIAMVKFLKWLKPAVEAGGQTEMSIERRLTAFKAEQPLFRGLSFDTIVGYEEHGAIVHYEASPETDAALQPKGLLLIDSGTQYQDGTTDVTRTIALGPLTEEQKKAYTLVLKGHIDLQLLRFPEGASGTQLDVIARRPLWQAGLNFLHGTGHGVGCYLNCHEGPHQIRMEWVPARLQAGMTVTDEPGVYLEGRFGVRIENTLLVTPCCETEFGRFLQFETLTLSPIDTTPILPDLLTKEEIAWLNDYHQRVFDTLSPHLSDEENSWLRMVTAPLN
ncbi:MAG: aminopeptidase P family protein [Bacteroidales bacterium]|nr:aminopeptidase P family protein [Bacteroidales bacterium]